MISRVCDRLCMEIEAWFTPNKVMTIRKSTNKYIRQQQQVILVKVRVREPGALLPSRPLTTIN